MAPGVVLTLLAATLLPAPTPPSLPPEDAWVAAKVELAQNNTERALTLVVRALPQGGPLAPLLRLEAAAIALRLGRDPYRYLAPLLRGPVPPNIARRAQELLLQGAEVLPLGQVTGWLKQPLPAFLRRQLRGVLALRTQDRAQSLQLLEEKANDALAGRLAQWLVATPLQRQEAGIVAGALLQTGHWQEAFDLLRTVPYHPE
ncbi:MAG: hypothetical protein N2447_02350, partial [Thermoanaerobaculum sp.]|nr:hypothetical protein [Thermoanaerobaculum sp.]